jgi:hypothetical protein
MADDRLDGVLVVHEVVEGIEAEDHRHALAVEEVGEGAAAGRAEQVDQAQDGGLELGPAPQGGAGVEVRGDEVGELGEGGDGERGLVLGRDRAGRRGRRRRWCGGRRRRPA